MKLEVISRGAYFIDSYELTSNNSGQNNNIYTLDKYGHFKFNCIKRLIDNHLYPVK